MSIVCPKCGAGQFAISGVCTSCGWVKEAVAARELVSVPCDQCNETGRIWEGRAYSRCPKCHGKTYVLTRDFQPSAPELVPGLDQAADQVAERTGEDPERCHMAIQALTNPLQGVSPSEAATILIAWYHAGRNAERQARRRAGIE